MIFITDTCFWRHIRDIQEDIGIDLRPFVFRVQWGLTEQVLQELQRFQIAQEYLEQNYLVVPVSSIELRQIRKKYEFLTDFDEPDQTLFLSAVRDGNIVLTDDRDLYRACLSIGVKSLLLPQFCLALVLEGVMDKRSVHRIIRHWENRGRFKKKELARIKEELQKIR
jgi:rRNA-processing protein FCF1